MTRKIIFGILAIAILVVGIMGFKRLRFYERSAWVFKTNSEQSFRRGRFERGGNEGREFRSRPENFREGERPDFRNLPDSVRQRMLAERFGGQAPDSLRRGSVRSAPGERDASGERNFRRDGRGRGGSDVRLVSVGWFLAVFAGFTVVTVYLDKIIKLIRRK